MAEGVEQRNSYETDSHIWPLPMELGGPNLSSRAFTSDVGFYSSPELKGVLLPFVPLTLSWP